MLPQAISNLRIAIVGASLGGLSVANVLNRLGANVTVYESYQQGFHLRGGALGYVDVELLADIRDARELSAIRGHGHFYGDLWSFLYDGLPKGTVIFDANVQEIRGVGVEDRDQLPQLVVVLGKDDGSSSTIGSCTVQDSRQEIMDFDLIIGADGGKSTVRPYVTDRVPKYAGYTLFRGLVNKEGIAGPPSGTARVNGFQYSTLGFPVLGPPGSDGKRRALWNCGVYMAMPESLVEKPTRNRQVSAVRSAVPDWFVPVVDQLFGKSNAKFWSECVKHGKVSPHPVWEVACDPVVKGRVALLGDAAHMASPHTGAGAYTAMVDAYIFGESIQEGGSLHDALGLYNQDTVKRGHELHSSSRRVGAKFAPPGRYPVSPETLLIPA
jgi:2-polyprenyl-6-methoxyphenol hydroxylase-like FAD-dependent oxidoreductase